MPALPKLETAGREQAMRAAREAIDRGYLKRRLGQMLGRHHRTAESVRRKYDRIAHDDRSYQKVEQALTADDLELVIVGEEVGLIPRLELLDYNRAYIAETIDRCGGTRLLEVGAGELNTLIPVVGKLARRPDCAVGMDISAERLAVGLAAADASGITGCLAGNAAALPFADKAFDIVFTSHCLEQSPGLVVPALKEFARVAGGFILLFEPAYKLAHALQRKRIRKLGYARGYVRAARELGLTVRAHQLLPAREFANGLAMTMIELGGS